MKEIEEPVRPVTSAAAYRGALWEEPEELQSILRSLQYQRLCLCTGSRNRTS